MSNETKTQVTFNKTNSSTWEIICGETCVGTLWSYKTTARMDCNGKRLTGGIVNYFVQLSGGDEVTFSVADYSSARSALAAAKRYVKETLSAPAPAEETRADEITAEVKQLRASAASVKDVEEEILELERERADLLYGTVEEEEQLTFNLFKHDTRDLRVLRVICYSAESGADKLELIRALKEHLGGGAGGAATWLGYFTNVCPHVIESGADYTLNVTAAQVTAELIRRGAETPVEETPVEEEATQAPADLPAEEEARCYHVTRCKFYLHNTFRGNPSAWSTDSSYATLDEARARFSELVAELGGAVDPSSLSAHSCEVIGDVGIQIVYDTLPARDNSKTYVGAHNGAYLYETSQEEEATQAPADLPVEEEELEPLVKGLPETPVEEEAQTIRVTPPQVDALRALGYEVRSCKLRYSSSQAEEILDSLYAERKLHTGAQRRVYTSIIDKVSQETKQAPNVALRPQDLRIEYRSLRAQRQILELIDAAESAGIVSRGSASTLRASCTPCTNIIIR